MEEEERRVTAATSAARAAVAPRCVWLCNLPTSTIVMLMIMRRRNCQAGRDTPARASLLMVSFVVGVVLVAVSFSSIALSLSWLSCRCSYLSRRFFPPLRPCCPSSCAVFSPPYCRRRHRQHRRWQQQNGCTSPLSHLG